MRDYAGAPDDCHSATGLPIALIYISGDFKDRGRLRRISKTSSPSWTSAISTPGNVFYYLATLPQFFAAIVRQLGEQAYQRRAGQLAARHHREAVRHRSGIGAGAESRHPAGPQREADLSHRSLPGQRDRSEYPGFPLFQRIFEPVWNRRYIDHVQITVAETLGVERRGGYYDHAGACAI